MVRSILLVTLSTLLIISILAPSVITLLNAKEKSSIVLNSGEEENQNEGKKDSTEKEFFFHTIRTVQSAYTTTKSLCNSTYIDLTYNFTQKVLLPPPEYFSVI